MPKAKPPPKRKKKDFAKLSQKQKFIATAKQAETDETGETFRHAFQKIVRAKPARPNGK